MSYNKITMIEATYFFKILNVIIKLLSLFGKGLRMRKIIHETEERWIFDANIFGMMTCPCSRRTPEQEEKFGSYCLECWDVVSISRECCACHAKIEDERLFVSASTKKVGCFWCFRQPSFPNSKKFPDGYTKPFYTRTMWPTIFHL